MNELLNSESTMTKEGRKNMKRVCTALLPLVAFCLSGSAIAAQSQQQAPTSGVVTRSIKAIGYQVGGGGTTVDLKSTELMPQANGEAKVEAKKGITNIEASIKGLAQSGKLGTEFLTYVLWGVSPDGRTDNVGEIQINNAG